MKPVFPFTVGSLILILLTLRPASAEVDTKVLKPGRTWVYAYYHYFNLMGSVSETEGIVRIRIDKVDSTRDSIAVNYTRTELLSGKDSTHSAVWHERYSFALKSERNYLIPFFISGADFNGDVSLVNYARFLPAGPLRRVKFHVDLCSGYESYSYLEGVGTLESESSMSGCSMSIQLSRYILLSVDGNPFYPAWVTEVPTGLASGGPAGGLRKPAPGPGIFRGGFRYDLQGRNLGGARRER